MPKRNSKAAGILGQSLPQDSEIKQANGTSEVAAEKAKENNVNTILSQLGSAPPTKFAKEPPLPSTPFVPAMTALGQCGQRLAQLQGADEAMQQMFEKEKRKRILKKQ